MIIYIFYLFSKFNRVIIDKNRNMSDKIRNKNRIRKEGDEGVHFSIGHIYCLFSIVQAVHASV